MTDFATFQLSQRTFRSILPAFRKCRRIGQSRFCSVPSLLCYNSVYSLPSLRSSIRVLSLTTLHSFSLHNRRTLDDYFRFQTQGCALPLILTLWSGIVSVILLQLITATNSSDANLSYSLGPRQLLVNLNFARVASLGLTYVPHRFSPGVKYSSSSIASALALVSLLILFWRM